MRLGIITFHSIINYGSALQAYAMQEGIAKQGVDTELIDYRPELRTFSIHERIKNNWKHLFDTGKWKRFLASKKEMNTLFYTDEEKSKKRAESFKTFQNDFFRLSKLIIQREELKDLNSLYDGFVCGSDQIWNPKYIGHDMTYFLDFVPGAKRIAYAPSIAVAEFPKEYRNEIKNEMNKFENISVRENESIEIVRALTGKDVTVVVDPTLLLTHSDWEKIERKPIDFIESTDYIFCYFLGANEEYIQWVNHLKRLTGLPVVLVTCTELKVFKGYGDISYEAIGPSEFVFLIHHANYICTDSFHGTVFSIINNKKFFTFKRYKDESKTSENSRIYTLLELIGHQERLIRRVEEITTLYQTSLDYEPIQKKILERKRVAEQYLKQQIERIKEKS